MTRPTGYTGREGRVGKSLDQNCIYIFSCIFIVSIKITTTTTTRLWPPLIREANLVIIHMVTLFEFRPYQGLKYTII